MLSPRAIDEITVELSPSRPRRRRGRPTGLMAGAVLLVALLGALGVAVVGLLVVMAFT